MQSIQNTKYKTSMCRHLIQKGVCSLYQKCHFAHSLSQLRQESDPIPNNVHSPIKPTSIYKTQLCKYFQKGYCKNKGQCTYAHGEQDLHKMSTLAIDQPNEFYKPVIQQQYYPYPNTNYMYPVYNIIPVIVPVVNQNNIYLLSILQNLQQIFPNNPQVLNKLKKAIDCVYKGDQNEVNEILKQIFNDSNRTESERQKYKVIINNAIYLNSIKSGYIYSKH